MIEPGGARRCHLTIKVDIRPVGEHKCRTRIVRAAEPAHLDDAAIGWRVGEGLYAPEAYMVSAAVGAVDHRIGLARQFVMQPLVDEAPGDRR